MRGRGDWPWSICRKSAKEFLLIVFGPVLDDGLEKHKMLGCFVDAGTCCCGEVPAASIEQLGYIGPCCRQ